MDLASIGSTEYFAYDAPRDPGLSLTATAAAAGISMLSPKIEILDAGGSILAQSGDPGSYSDHATAASRLFPGGHYSIEVTGAANNVFATGNYELRLQVNGLPSPAASGACGTGTSIGAP